MPARPVKVQIRVELLPIKHVDGVILFGERSLRTAVREFMAHYHEERNHQGLDNRLIQPNPDQLANTGPVQRHARLGGKLNYYYRAAA